MRKTQGIIILALIIVLTGCKAKDIEKAIPEEGNKIVMTAENIKEGHKVERIDISKFEKEEVEEEPEEFEEEKELEEVDEIEIEEKDEDPVEGSEAKLNTKRILLDAGYFFSEPGEHAVTYPVVDGEDGISFIRIHNNEEGTKYLLVICDEPINIDEDNYEDKISFKTDDGKIILSDEDFEKIIENNIYYLFEYIDA